MVSTPDIVYPAGFTLAISTLPWPRGVDRSFGTVSSDGPFGGMFVLGWMRHLDGSAEFCTSIPGPTQEMGLLLLVPKVQ